jgi:hypothetical protein
MEKKTNSNKKLVFFQSDEELDSFFDFQDRALEPSDSSSSVQSDLSPFNIRFSNNSNGNSPVFDKWPLAEKKSPARLEIVCVPFNIKSQIRKKQKSEELDSQKNSQKLDDALVNDKQKVGSARDNISLISKIDCQIHESTAIGSRSLYDRDAAPLTLECTANLIEAEYSEYEDRTPIDLSRLLKLKPAYQLLCAYFNGGDCTSKIANLERDFEFKILAMICSYLKLSFSGSSNLTMQQKLSALLQSQPKRLKKRQKMVQMIFTQITNILQYKWQVSRSKGDSKNFLETYFDSICSDKGQIEAEFSITKNCSKKNLTYSFITKCFKSKKFRDDFSQCMKTDFIEYYNISRARRLKSVLLKWEGLFLELKKEEEVLDAIQTEISTTKFRLAWTNKEIESYFNYFEKLCLDLS